MMATKEKAIDNEKGEKGFSFIPLCGVLGF